MVLGTASINGCRLRSGSSCKLHCPSGLLSHTVCASKRNVQLNKLLQVQTFCHGQRGSARKASALLRKVKAVKLSHFEYGRIRQHLRKLQRAGRRLSAVVYFEECPDTIQHVLAASRQFQHLYKEPFSVVSFLSAQCLANLCSLQIIC